MQPVEFLVWGKKALYACMRMVYTGGLLGLWSMPVHAAGLTLPARGVAGMMRGGASIAGNDSLQSMWYNPANLAASQRVRMLIDTTLLLSPSRFTRAPNVQNGSVRVRFDEVQSLTAMPDPSLLFAWGWPTLGLTMGAGLYAPYARTSSYPEQGAQRYSVVGNQGSLIVIAQLSLAWAMGERFRIGGSLQNAFARFSLRKAISGYTGLFGTAEDPDLDAMAQVDAMSWLGVSANFGLWGRLFVFPGGGLDLAASVQLPFVMNAAGALQVYLPTHPLYRSARFEGEGVEVTLQLPWILRTAARLNLGEGRVDFEAAFVLEMWSSQEQLLIRPLGRGIFVRNIPVLRSIRVERIVLLTQWKDAYSLRLGGSLQLYAKRSSGTLAMTWGYAFESSAVPTSTQRVGLDDAPKHLLAVGLRWRWAHCTLDLAYALYWFVPRDVQGSVVRQINVIMPETAQIVGNGRYEAMVHGMGVGVEVAW